MDVLHHHAVVYTKYAVGMIGLLGNILVTVSVAYDKQLRSVTFVAIGGLAFSDSLVLISSFLIWFLPAFKMEDTELMFFIVTNVRNSCLLSSALHITLIAVVRYIIIANPIRSGIILNTRKTFIISVFIFIFSFVVFCVYSTITAMLKPNSGLIITVCMSSVTYFLPVCSMIAFHIAKCKKLQGALSAVNYKTYKKMSRLLAVVILTSCILPLPTIVTSITFYRGYDVPLEIWGISALLYVLNSCINPFLYCFMSQKFRQSVARIFCRLCRSKRSLRYSATLVRTNTLKSNIINGGETCLLKQVEEFEMK